MPIKAKPVTRQDVMRLAVTDADAFTALRYLRHRESVPAIPELEEKGETQLPGIEGSLLDLYYGLWEPEPTIKQEVTPDRRYWHGLLDQAMKSTAYQELHATTQLQEFQSVLGTISMGESVVGMIPKEDQEKLQELSEAQQSADEMQQQANDLQQQANAADQLAQAAGQGQPQPGQGDEKPSDQLSDSDAQPGQGKPKPGKGKPQKSSGKPQGEPSGQGQMTPEEARAIANQLAEQATETKANAQAAQELASEAQAKAEALAQDLMGKPGSQKADEKLRELARIGLQAVKDAQAKVEEVSDTIETWGLDEAELFRKGVPESMAILDKMKRNKDWQKFAALLGRSRKIAARKAKAKIAGEGVRITTVETGRDLKRAYTSELVALINPALRVKALQRWTRGELRLHGQKTKQKLGHGPVIDLEDASGSMDGAKQQFAKAVSLGMAHFAKIQKRSFGWVLFDSRVVKSKVYPQGKLTPEQMLEIAESRSGGGTDFEKPLRKAMEMIRNEGLKKADILLNTDGECTMSNEFVRELKAFKKELEVNIIVVLCDAGSSTDASLKEIADRIERASAFSADEIERKIFAHL